MGREARAADKMRAALSLVLENVKLKKSTFMRSDNMIKVLHSPPLKDGKQYYIAHMLSVVEGTPYVGGVLMTGEEDLELLQARCLEAEAALYRKLGVPMEEPVDAPPATPDPVDV